MPKAFLLRDFADVNLDPHHKLYRLEDGGPLPQFTIVSVFRYPANRRGLTCEARFLASDPSGTVTGDFEGLGDEITDDHDEALRRRGYSVG